MTTVTPTETASHLQQRARASAVTGEERARRLRARLPAVVRCLRQDYGVDQVILFGSVANQTCGPSSDLDLAVSYCAIESIMQRTARAIDGDLPAGADWHPSLLHVMGLEIEGIRPAVLSRESVAALRELLAFRRFFRHAYAAEFDPERLAWLRDVLLGAAPRLVHELAALDAFLAEVAAVSTDPRG